MPRTPRRQRLPPIRQEKPRDRCARRIEVCADAEDLPAQAVSGPQSTSTPASSGSSPLRDQRRCSAASARVPFLFHAVEINGDHGERRMRFPGSCGCPVSTCPGLKRDAANDVVERSPVGVRRYEMEMWLLQNPGAAKEEQTPFCPFWLGNWVSASPLLRRFRAQRDNRRASE
jgi:hypothetical protein